MDDQLQRLRRLVAGQGATDDESVLRLAAAITRSRGLGSATARTIARDLFWADVRGLAIALGPRVDFADAVAFAEGRAEWRDLSAPVRMACEATGRLNSPAEWREVLAQVWTPLAGQRHDAESEQHVARREFVRQILAEIDRSVAFGDTTPYHGMRVRWPGPGDHHPHFVVPEGATGTVIRSSADGDPAIVVRLDQHLDGAEEWDNEVHWPLADVQHFFAEVEPIA